MYICALKFSCMRAYHVFWSQIPPTSPPTTPPYSSQIPLTPSQHCVPPPTSALLPSLSFPPPLPPRSPSLCLSVSLPHPPSPVCAAHIFLGVGPFTGAWVTTRSHTIEENWARNHQLSIASQLGVVACWTPYVQKEAFWSTLNRFGDFLSYIQNRFLNRYHLTE